MTFELIPSLVQNLVKHCDGWIIGEAAEPEAPTLVEHYQVIIPPQYWEQAAGYIPKKIKLNELGGLELMIEDVKITMWTGDIHQMFTSQLFTFAWHPKSDVRIIRLNKEDM